MLNAREIIDIYISFFEKRGHKRIENSPIVPQNDPTTLFTSSGMQPLVPYFLGELHPMGKRLVNVQNCFRAQDVDEVGDNRHITFFRMLGNWSLGDYFKSEQIPWFFEFLTKGLGLPTNKLYVSVFKGFDDIPKDEESAKIWKNLFENAGINSQNRIFYYGPKQNWWSRSGIPKDMPIGEPGGPDSEVFFDLGIEHDKKYGERCHINCDCEKFLEIGNSVFMEYKKIRNNDFEKLSQKNVDFGGGLERLLAAIENKSDIFQTSLFSPIIKAIENETGKKYEDHKKEMRIMTDHFIASTFITASNITPSNKEQGYILRRLIRRGFDNFYQIGGKEITSIIESIIGQYKETDPDLDQKFENIKNTILEEEQSYLTTREKAKILIEKKYKIGDELKGVSTISSDDAFLLYSTHGLSPTQIKSLGYEFNEQEFAKKMEEHQKLSRAGAQKKFKGGLIDNSEMSIKYHTATHLLHAALRKILGSHVEQKGSNITVERLRFDFSHSEKLTDEEIRQIEDLINEKINENLPVTFEIVDKEEALKSGALGFFTEKYADKVKVYIINGFSKEICGGPHVDFTGKLKRFTIIKQENIGHGQRRIYAKLEN
ncbi:MAG: alanine--tRNA ligase [Patescibacteria group bacterium]|nr:alanine--tRNA ligase [Patescibacteria group bacterium]